MQQGYIKLHRSILDNPIFQSKPFSKGLAWIALLLLTNHKENLMPVKNGQMLKIRRGECGYSELALADIFGWSRGKVKRFLMLLESEKMIQQKIVANHSVIKILNYSQYQDDTTNDTTNGQQTIQQTIQQTDINKNDKNEKNIYRIPKKEEILEYVALLGKKIEIDKFIAYYDAAEWRDKSGLQVNWKQKALLWANSYKPKQEEITEYVYNPNT